jgi:Ca2+-binding RTX toxin-like protein
MAHFIGTAGDDIITRNIISDGVIRDPIGSAPGATDDILEGRGGNDSLKGKEGNDLLDGGSGNDTAAAGDGDDTVIGGTGDDSLIGGLGINTVDYRYTDAAGRIDLIAGIAGLGSEIDSIFQFQIVLGSEGDNTIIGAEAAETLRGNGGDDSLVGGGGDDSLMGGYGNDTLVGGAGNDTLFGGVGLDVLDGGEGYDTVDYSSSVTGGTIDLAAQRATIAGVTEFLVSIENVFGSAGADLVIGSDESNTLSAGTGDDTFSGGAGDDRISGAAGLDVIDGGGGLDVLVGGAGADRFVFSLVADSAFGAGDVITDFVSGIDKIVLAAVATGGTFIGGATFTAGGGVQARYAAALHQLQVDVNDNGVFDAGDLQLDGLTSPLVAADILFA